MAEQVSSLKAGIRYKDTPIGKIPVDWEVGRLGELAAPIKNAFSDGPFGSNLKLEDYMDSGIPVLQGKNITKNRLKWFDIRYVTKKKAEEHSRSLATLGDILMTKIGTVGCVAIVNDLKGYDYALIPANLMKITLNGNKVDTHFLYQFLLWPVTRKRIVDISSQTAQPALSLKAMKAFEIALPPLLEQKKIAEILGTVDEAIENTAQVIEKTKEVKKGLMQKLLTRGIGHEKFKKTEIGEIPEEWEVRRFKELLNKGILIEIQDGNHGSDHPKSSDYVPSGVPFIMANNLINGTVDTQSCKFIRKEQADKLRVGFAKTGDVLLSHKGTIGRVAIVPEIKDYIMLTPQVTYYRIGGNNKLSKVFLRYFMESERFQETITRLSKQSTRSYIGISQQKNLSMVLPPLNEQKQIAAILSSVDREIEEEANRKEGLESLKKGLMQVLLTGKIRVTV